MDGVAVDASLGEPDLAAGRHDRTLPGIERNGVEGGGELEPVVPGLEDGPSDRGRPVEMDPLLRGGGEGGQGGREQDGAELEEDGDLDLTLHGGLLSGAGSRAPGVNRQNYL